MKTLATINVDYVKTADLIPYAANSRTHSDEQVAQIAASIKEFGFTNPILTDGDGGIIAGHGRLMAARKLGLDEVPTIALSGLTAAQKRAYVIADNKLALNAGWDAALLSSEIAGLGEDGFDLSLLGFNENELAALLVEKTEGLTDPDEIPEVPDIPKTVLGDVWTLGKHRIVCGDSTSVEAADAVGAGSADMTLSDPPYGIGYSYESHDDSDNAANAQLVWDAFALGPDAKVWTPGLNNLARDIERFGKARVIVWFKKFAAAGNGLGGASTWEPILTVGHTPERKLKNDVLEIMTDRETVGGVSLRQLHTCPKPVALYAALAEALTKPGQSIFEPFSGSGTTIIACEKTGRHCKAIEIDPRYVDVAVKRWQEFTGEKAIHAETGLPFDEHNLAEAA